MENAIIQFEVMVNIVLLLLIVLMATYIAIQGQKVRAYEKRMQSMREAVAKHKTRRLLEKETLHPQHDVVKTAA